MCISIVNHQLNRIHPWCSWEGTLPGRWSPGKRCHTFWNGNIMLLPIVLGNVCCAPEQWNSGTFCRILGLTALNSLLQYVNWLVWEVCSVN